VAPDKSDEQGVLGNLPRSRPGQRSAKRGGGSTAKAAPATRAKVAKAKARTKAKSSAAGTRAKRPRKPAAAPPKTTVTTASERREPPPQAPASGDDPVTGAVKVAAKVATIGPRAAIGITKRLLGR
jgi:hypothetical protein